MILSNRKIELIINTVNENSTIKENEIQTDYEQTKKDLKELLRENEEIEF